MYLESAGQTLLISEDDLRALGKLSDTSARFEDGSGYLGQLDVYHELHCLYASLDKIWSWCLADAIGITSANTFIETTTPMAKRLRLKSCTSISESSTAVAVPQGLSNYLSCTDTLRQITMCHADISIVTFDCVDHHWQPYPDFAIERECRNWDSIFEYAKSHQPDMHNGSFFHPKYGPYLGMDRGIQAQGGIMCKEGG